VRISRHAPNPTESEKPNNTFIEQVTQTVSDITAPSEPKPVFASAELAVPYIAETPDGVWVGSWKNGCEEAAITMVEKFYAGLSSVSKEEAKAGMQILFDWQNAQYGEDANSDAQRMLAIMKANSSFEVELVRNPTIEAIKAELDAGHPVIAIHRGFDLKNKNIPFIPTASSYHATVISGYGDKYEEFIVQDTGDTKHGANHRYGYELYMNSLHDYTVATNKADGPATVFFTQPNLR
jgi:hypothetical protein